MPLLETILTHTSSVMFLAPHFSPMQCSDEHFIALYDKTVSSISSAIDTVVFVLLSKFELANWLSRQHQPPSQRSVTNFMSQTTKAIGLIGREPNTEGMVILEVLRNHMNTLLHSDLNTHYWVVLTELLSLSNAGSVSVFCWNDFLNILDFREDLHPAEECRVSIDHVKESLHYMASFFKNACETINCELETLYKLWEPYIGSLTILLKNLFSYSITHSLYHRGERPRDAALRDQWETVVSVYRPWIIPRLAGKVWTLLRVESVVQLVESFVGVVHLLVDISLQDGGESGGGSNAYCFILNDLLAFYASEIGSSVREEQSIDIFHTSLSMLPWKHLCPTLQDMAFVLQVLF